MSSDEYESPESTTTSTPSTPTSTTTPTIAAQFANASSNTHQHQHQHQHHIDENTSSPDNGGELKSSSSKDDSHPLKHGCEDNWTWSKRHRSKEVVLSGPNNRTVHFHPNWSKGTAGVQGKRPLNNGRFYWELHLTKRVFGTAIMFGIGTKHARLHANSFRNMLGENEHGWGLSHKGVLWHKGVALLYTSRFRENQATVVGVLFDGIEGTLTYYKDGTCLGVAFRGLDKIKEPLYPIVCSTAAKTELTLKCARRDFVNLQDRCRAEIIKHVKNRRQLADLNLPPSITAYLSEVYNDIIHWRQVDNYDLFIDF